MTLQHAISLFESLSDEGKAKVLGEVSFSLTITSRIVRSEGTHLQQNEKLASIEELQHSALGQMLAYLERDPKRYSDRDIFSILLESAKNAGLLADLQRAFEKALSNFAQKSR
ncbi:MAG TPA: hypothetical protein VJN89_20860 [Candidatus Acidoferrum sp.]|nr:hypothetical protein [Candidatus Acidoferrum sp.]